MSRLGVEHHTLYTPVLDDVVAATVYALERVVVAFEVGGGEEGCESVKLKYLSSAIPILLKNQISRPLSFLERQKDRKEGSKYHPLDNENGNGKRRQRVEVHTEIASSATSSQPAPPRTTAPNPLLSIPRTCPNLLSSPTPNKPTNLTRNSLPKRRDAA